MPLHLVVDGLPARKKASVKDYVTCTEGRLTLHFPPGYAPDLNPDELVWSHAKRTGTARRPLMKDEKLLECVHEQLQRIGENKNLIRSFFKHPSVALCFRLLSNCKRIFQALLHNAFYLEQALAKLALFVESIRYKVL